MLTTLTITQEDIDKGEREESDACPIALALRRETGKDYEVLGDEIVLYDPDTCGRLEQYDLSQKAQDFIITYDDGFPVLPTTFDPLIIPKESNE